MKITFKSLQFLFKFLASVFSKIGATHTYSKLFKKLFKYKLFSILYNIFLILNIPIKLFSKKLIFIIKIIGIILSIFSLFHGSLSPNTRAQHTYNVVIIIKYIRKN